jgi:osmotically-inducible protein OsmY
MKTDAQLQRDIESEPEWDASINAANVGVAVKAGVVTVNGHLDAYAEKHAVERAVQRVRGVRALAIELGVKLSPDHRRSDAEVAAAAEAALQWHSLVPHERVRVKVEQGWVRLAGELDWEYQRANAEQAVRPLTGVVGVSKGAAWSAPGITLVINELRVE